MISMNATLKNITAMLIFGSIGLFVRNIELASSQIALVRGFVGAFILFIAMVCLHKKNKIEMFLIKKFTLFINIWCSYRFYWIFFISSI